MACGAAGPRGLRGSCRLGPSTTRLGDATLADVGSLHDLVLVVVLKSITAEVAGRCLHVERSRHTGQRR